MIIKTDDRGMVSQITNNNGTEIKDNAILSADITMRATEPTKIEMVNIFKNSELSLNIDNISIYAKIPESFNLMDEDEKLLFLSMIEEYGYIEKKDDKTTKTSS